MTTLLNLRTTDATKNRDALALTCDYPVAVMGSPRAAAPATAVCRPTGRSPYGRSVIGSVPRVSPDQRRPARAPRSNMGSAQIDDSNNGARQVWTASVLTGIGLALLVVVFGFAGSDYQSALAQEPVQTQVVHVRSGESLSALAARIAPELPAASVIATVRDLNDLASSGLRPGQALVVPAYR
ncbi:MAG: LysM peptidoglycan-binding domain-containing protein [Gordonia sp. (in: high G+C Gram-positive bacteria)]|uniref:LysM peptidoglycan-binding domain-containing protein n=1 Tax=Gordonia sp. (in: high G+C Gram-positive bacteria) TaxID=84139 RepID=UPI003BB723FA